MSAQAALWDDLTGSGRSHREDPETSREAAKADQSGLRGRVLEALKAAGTRGLSDDELRAATNAAYRHSVATRRRELQDRGYPIRDSGRRAPTPSGKSSVVWCWIAEDEGRP